MLTITEAIKKSVEEFKNKLQQYNEGKLDNLKSFSSIMGIYKEGPKDTYMVRARIPGGVIKLDQLKAISEIAKKYEGIKIRFTTRQDIQFHSVKIEYLGDVLDDLLECGLTTKGAGGDGVRNVACSPLSGVARDEIFDVTPYMKEVSNYMMTDPTNLNLPRKYKIAFSNSLEDTANATVADIGFIAKIVDGKRGFEVYGGGGLGGSAKISLKLEDFIADTEVLYYVQAMKQVFAREGDRTNRHKARLRFVVQRLGEEAFINVFRNELNQLKAEQDLKLHIDSGEEKLQKSQGNPWEKKYENVIFPQQQIGYYSVYIHPRNATIHTSDLDKVINFLTNLNYATSIRVTSTQGFFVRDLKETDVQELIDIMAKFSSIFNIENSVACVGPTVCNFGINDSQELLNSVFEIFQHTSDDIRTALPRILISGCPNSCAQHQKALIGFTGKRSRTDSGMIPTYAISFNGRVGPNIARFGEVYGDIPAEKIATFLLELAKLKINLGYISFVEFIENEEKAVRELVAKYSL
ncbi:MAG: Ferredoxin--nitrite reductase [Pelosinus sp.]|jgi:sulfite reductase (ferredoxin)|nr:Ferredoxin--nitrite reductase [Pelosinus sp.]